MKPLFSIIIPVTRQDCVSRLISSLSGQIKFNREKWEIFFVLSKSIKIKYETIPFASSLIFEEGLHPSLRRNAAVKNCSGKWLVFLDDDIVLERDYLSVIENTILSSGGEFDIFTGPQQDTNLQKNTFSLSDLLKNHALATARKTKGAMAPLKFYEISLCNCVMKKQVFDHAGGFNDLAHYQIDDTEFFYIALGLGYKAVFLKNLMINHAYPPSFVKFLLNRAKKRFFTGFNSILFIEIYSKIPFYGLAWGVNSAVALACFLRFRFLPLWLVIADIVLLIILTPGKRDLPFLIGFSRVLLTPLDHLISLFSFTSGCIVSVICLPFKQHIIINKKKRLAVLKS
jgi:glycosyltransferase involved in cell wall biosynthesis